MRRIIVFLSITAAVAAHPSEVHKKMTKDEIIYTFGNEGSEDKVPSYDVSSITHKQNPDHTIIELTSFSRKMRLYLEPTDGYLADVKTPVFQARHHPGMPNEVLFKRIPGAISRKYKMYHDPVNDVAVVIHHDRKGFPLINGVINFLKEKHSLVIRPLPSRLQKLFHRNKRSVDSNNTVEDPDLEYTHHHVVYKMHHEKSRKVNDYMDENEDDYNDESDVVDDDNEVDHGEHEELGSEERLVGDKHVHIDLVAMAHNKRKRGKNININNVPEIVYPQVLVVVDPGFFNHFKRNVPSIIEYLLAFWNGVDLRYRAYQKPEIRLNIAGIILAEDYSMTPYILNSRVHVKELNKNKINVVDALRAKAAFLFKETTKNETDQTLTMKRLGFKFDFVITMTTLDVCQFLPNCMDEKTREYTCDTWDLRNYCDTRGFAYYTGGCAFDSEYQEMEGTGIIEDKGSFFAIVPTAHEIGHLLGASHDKHNEYQCEWNDGHLMAYDMSVGKEKFIWSNCSAESVKMFLKREQRAQCMFDVPNTGNTIPRKLPGKMFSKDELCHRAIPGARACEDPWYQNSCVSLYCRPPNAPSNICSDVRHHLVPEGASCGKRRFCLNGICVNEKDPYVHLELATTTTELPLTHEDSYLLEEETNEDCISDDEK